MKASLSKSACEKWLAVRACTETGDRIAGQAVLHEIPGGQTAEAVIGMHIPRRPFPALRISIAVKAGFPVTELGKLHGAYFDQSKASPLTESDRPPVPEGDDSAAGEK